MCLTLARPLASVFNELSTSYPCSLSHLRNPKIEVIFRAAEEGGGLREGVKGNGRINA